jgi:hypothetical protein
MDPGELSHALISRALSKALLNEVNLYQNSRSSENEPGPMQRAEQLMGWQSDRNINQLYFRYKDNPLIKWKDSIKKKGGDHNPD